jgi:hypothetical protein
MGELGLLEAELSLIIIGAVLLMILISSLSKRKSKS